MAGRGMAGRGRGRGRGLLDGSPVEPGDAPQPPKLYPDRDDLPKDKSISREDEQLLNVWSQLENRWHYSVFNLDRGGGGAGVDGAGPPHPPPSDGAPSTLSELLTLHPSVFPEELFSRADRSKSAQSAAPGAAAALFARARADAGAGNLFERLETLDRMEGAGGEGEGTGRSHAQPRPPPDGAPADDDDADGDGAAAADDEEDGYEDEDDYLQGPQYDDDEEYEADDGDGDGEATY